MALREKRLAPTYLQITKGFFRHWDGEKSVNYEEVTGHITDVSFGTRDQTANQKFPNHEDIRLTIQDGDDTYQVSCTAKTGAGRGLMKQLPSINPGSNVLISLSYEEEFKATSVFFKQDDTAVSWMWSKKKGNMDEIPAGVKYLDPSDNVEKTQYNDQTEFLKAYILANVKPNLVKPEPVHAEVHQEESYQEELPPSGGDPDDDVPF